MPPDLSVLSLAGAGLICLGAATVQGTVGMGFALLAVPLCALIDPRLAPVPHALLSVLLVVPMALHERRFIQPRRVAWILVGRVPGAILGVALLKLASARTISLLLAGFVLAAVIALSTGLRVRRSPAVDCTAGVFSGIGSLVASIGGPPVALLYKDEVGGAIRANLALVASVGLMLTLGARTISGEIARLDLLVAGCLAPVMWIALRLSRRLAPQVEGPALRRAVLALAGLAALGLAVRALIGW